MARRSPAELGAEEYYKVKDELAGVIESLHQAQRSMTAEEFRGYMRGIELDEAAARDFLASDGSVESMTDRMWVYFESSLSPL